MARIPVRPREQKWYGWRRSLPDFRDRRFTIPEPLIDASKLPVAVDLRTKCPRPMDQGDLGSCVAHGVTAAMRADRMNQNLVDIPLSRLQLYWDGRNIEGTVNEDSGLEIRDAIKCAARIGVAKESDWPYNITKFKRRPPTAVYRNAVFNEALQYQAVAQTVHAIKAALASGHPVVIGISVYESFESKEVDKTGAIPMPKATEQMLGGHCMYLWGYDDKSDSTRALGRNSWGPSWGNHGDFSIPWDYLTNYNLAGDFWIITTVGAAK